MANSWLRLWHDMPNDPKWRTISRVSNQPVSLVQAVFIHLLVSASRNVTRGHVDVTPEDLASALDVTESEIIAVLEAMQGRVLDGNFVSGWDKRQVIREDSGNSSTTAKSAAERKREQRERQKAEGKSHDMSQHVTQESRRVTTDKDKDKDKDKRSKNIMSGTEQVQPQTSEPVFISLPLSDGGSQFDVTESYLREQMSLYPGVNIEQELRNMRGWLDSNPAKRKTQRGIKRFITTWLQNSQDKPRGWQGSRTNSGRDVNTISTPDRSIPPGFRGYEP